MPFWKADEPATRWRRLGRNTRDALGSVADDTRGLAATAGHEVRDRVTGAADTLARKAGVVEARPSRRPPRPVALAALVAVVAAVVWVGRNLKGRAASEEATPADEPAPTTAATPANAANANGAATPEAEKGRAAS